MPQGASDASGQGEVSLLTKKMKTLTLTILAATVVLIHSARAEPTNADNSGKNARDKSGQTMTPFDQSNKPADIKITADTRKMLVGDDSLSMDAKNVKIMTVDGAVTLRGPVKSSDEKSLVEKHTKMAGASAVTNELEIVKP